MGISIRVGIGETKVFQIGNCKAAVISVLLNTLPLTKYIELGRALVTMFIRLLQPLLRLRNGRFAHWLFCFVVSTTENHVTLCFAISGEGGPCLFLSYVPDNLLPLLQRRREDAQAHRTNPF